MKNRLIAILLVVVLAVGLGLVPPTPAGADPGSVLVARWSFDDNANDSSGNNNHGTVYGATYVTGKFGKALSFDGTDDYVEVPDSPSLDLDRVTIEAWIYFDTNRTGHNNIVRKGPYSDRCYGLDIGVPGTNRIRGWVNLGPGGGSTAWIANGATTLAVNTWHHVAMTYDGSQVRVYVNGVQDGISGTTTGNIFDNNLTVRIGGQPLATEGRLPFKGLIDEVRIWGTALTPSQLDDMTPPTVTATVSTAPNSTGWNNTDVTVTFSATDTGSGVATVTPPVTVTTEGAGQTVTGTATDYAGNVGTASVTLNIDKTPPTITATATANGSPYTPGTWTNKSVTVSYSASDALSGIDAAASDLGDDVLGEGADQSASGTAVDNAGNSATATVSDINIDKTTPVVTITAPTATAYTLNQTVLADWTAMDALSGIASASGTVPSGSPIDTGTVGEKTFEVTATDNAGNTKTEKVTYRVGYAFVGILQPINADGSSIFKLGSTVPVKFQLRDANGNFVTNAVARIFVLKISNGVNGTELEAVSTAASTTGNLFRYDFASNQYIFNLATKPLSVGTWQIRIELNDGTSQYVNIGLR